MVYIPQTCLKTSVIAPVVVARSLLIRSARCDEKWQREVKLLKAARLGDLEGVLQAIESGAGVEARDKTHMNWTAGHRDSVPFLQLSATAALRSSPSLHHFSLLPPPPYLPLSNQHFFRLLRSFLSLLFPLCAPSPVTCQPSIAWPLPLTLPGTRAGPRARVPG